MKNQNITRIYNIITAKLQNNYMITIIVTNNFW